MGDNGRWVCSPKPVKLNEFFKAKLQKTVNDFIAQSERLKNEVNRTDIKAGRIYLYHLVEQFIPKSVDVKLIRPLIEGKYLEFPMARITVYNVNGNECTADWLRHTGQWYTLNKGTLEECLKFIEDNQQWFN